MEAIRYYVKGAFQGVKASPEVLEQQEELIADLTAKVADLVAEGKSQEEALGVAIASMGDLSTLVAEFEPAEETPDRDPTVSVWGTRLDLHVIAVSVGIGGAVLIAGTALGAWMRLVHPGAGFSLLAVLGLGIWWVVGAYRRYVESPDLVQVRHLVQKPRFRRALTVWAGVVIGSTLINAIGGTDFWCWPFWVAGGTWALAVKVEGRLLNQERLLAPMPEAEAA